MAGSIFRTAQKFMKLSGKWETSSDGWVAAIVKGGGGYDEEEGVRSAALVNGNSETHGAL